MKFRHKNIRLNRLQYKGQRSYFVTFCCERRRPVFANGRHAEWLIDMLRRQSASFKFSVYAYCVMQDHFHALVTGTDPVCDLLEFVSDLKEITTSEYGERLNQVLWQKKFYDHILRPRDRVEGVAGYIWMNPVRAGLCSTPQEYPYSGSFVIDWKKGFSPLESWTPEWRKDKGARQKSKGKCARLKPRRPLHRRQQKQMRPATPKAAAT